MKMYDTNDNVGLIKLLPSLSASQHHDSLATQMRLCGPIMICDHSGESQHITSTSDWGDLLHEGINLKNNRQVITCVVSVQDTISITLKHVSSVVLIRAQGHHLQMTLAFSFFSLTFLWISFWKSCNTVYSTIYTCWEAHEQVCCHFCLNQWYWQSQVSIILSIK